eukprot:3932158-Rhodomonas_salina.1
MVAGGYLNEKSVLEIWAARPPDTTPFYQRAAISRALGEKYKVCYKTVQKIWRKASWAKLTDRAPVPAQSEGQDVSPDPAIYTGTTADTTADSVAEVEAGMGPEHSLLPRVSSTPSASPFFSVHDNLPSPLNSNFSVAANDGIIPDSSLLPPPSSLLFPPAPPYLARELSPLQFSNFATQDSVPHDQTDRQEIVIASHFDTEEPLSSLASNWVPANSRARHVEGRQCRLGTACFRCKAQRLNFGGNQPRMLLLPRTIHGMCRSVRTCVSTRVFAGGVCIMDLASEFAVESGRDPLLPSVILHSEHSTYTPVTGEHRRVVAPEHPIAYPDGPITGVTYVVPQEKGPDSPWPLSMVRLFRGYRLADGIWWRMLQLMTPKLRATTLRVFRTLDNQFLLAQLGHIPPKIPSEWSKPSQNSLRCGIMTLRMDGRSDQMTGIDANPFWTGLHAPPYAMSETAISLCYATAFAPPRPVLSGSVVRRPRRAPQGRVREPRLQLRNAPPVLGAPPGCSPTLESQPRLRTPQTTSRRAAVLLCSCAAQQHA